MTPASASQPVPAMSVSHELLRRFVVVVRLVFTVFQHDAPSASARLADIAIGLVVFAAIIPVAPTTGASMDPARTFGPMLVQRDSRVARCRASSCRISRPMPAAGVLAAFASCSRSPDPYRREPAPSPFPPKPPPPPEPRHMKKLIDDPARCRRRGAARNRRRAPGARSGPGPTGSSTVATRRYPRQGGADAPAAAQGTNRARRLRRARACSTRLARVRFSLPRCRIEMLEATRTWTKRRCCTSSSYTAT